MKALIIVLVMTAMAHVCIAQNDKGYKIGLFGAYNQRPLIENVYTEKDSTVFAIGSGFIFTIKNSSLNYDSDVNINLGLCCYLRPNAKEYFFKLGLSSKKRLYVWKDTPLLLKLTDGEVLELKSSLDSEDNHGRYISLYFPNKEYVISSFYEISKEYIDKVTKGITKMRFKLNSDFFDLECHKYKNDEIGDFIRKEVELINSTLSKYTNMDIYDGF